jgi:chromosome segregation ATPase
MEEVQPVKPMTKEETLTEKIHSLNQQYVNMARDLGNLDYQRKICQDGMEDLYIKMRNMNLEGSKLRTELEKVKKESETYEAT